MSVCRAALVVSHFRENLCWLYDVDVDKYAIILVSKTLPSATLHQQHNLGDEATAYMEYIITYYDELPPYSVFVHAHEHSYHHVGRMQDLVNRLSLDTPYYNFNGSPTNDQFYHVLFESGKVPASSEMEHAFWERHRHRLFSSIGGLPPLEQRGTMRFRMSAQFAVHRDLIRRHTRDQWRGILNSLMDMCRENTSTREFGKTFEYSWFTLFTGQTDEKLWNDRIMT